VGVAAVVAAAAPAHGVDLEVGVAYSMNGTPGIMSSWEDGPGLVLGLATDDPGAIEAEARLSWRPAPLGNCSWLGPPHIPEAYYSECYGEATYYYRASLGVRFSRPAVHSPYVALRTGILVADLGQIARLEWGGGHPAWSSVLGIPGTGETVTEPYFAVGVGTAAWRVFGSRMLVEVEMSTIPDLGGVSLQSGAYMLF
jgi:hypothetical protein